MKNEENEKLLSYIERGRHKVYCFYDHDEYTVKFKADEDSEEYIIIQKQALAALAEVVKNLADEFTK